MYYHNKQAPIKEIINGIVPNIKHAIMPQTANGWGVGFYHKIKTSSWVWMTELRGCAGSGAALAQVPDVKWRILEKTVQE